MKLSAVSVLCIGLLKSTTLAFTTAPSTCNVPKSFSTSPTTTTASLSRLAKRSSAVSPLFAKKAVVNKAVSSSSAVAKLSSVLGKASTSTASFLALVAKELNALNQNQKCIFLAVFAFGYWLGKSPPIRFKKYLDALDIPNAMYGPKAPLLKGRVVSVSDGDTFRFLHTPTPWSKSRVVTKGPGKEKLSENSMPIRICTYDTPETPKFGKPGQPFGLEAKEELVNLIDDKIIQIRLLQKDQYGRAVAQVFVPSSRNFILKWMKRLLFFLPSTKSNQCIDEVMLSKGLGEVYVGGGAVYGPKGKDFYMDLQKQAQKAKVGIWSQGSKRESAADYKRRTK